MEPSGIRNLGRVVRLGALCALLLSAVPSALAQNTTAPLAAPHVAVLAADLGPMARIDLTWPGPFRVAADHAPRVLVLTFDQPFNAPDLGALRQRLDGWISGIHKTADGLRLTARQDVYFQLHADRQTLSIEMTLATGARAVAGLQRDQRPALIPPPRPVQRSLSLTPPAGRTQRTVTLIPPVPAPRPGTVAETDARAQAALKRLRRASASGGSSEQTTFTAQMTAPAQLYADLTDDDATIVIDWAEPVILTPTADAGELLLRLTQPVDSRLVEGLAEQMPEWLSGASAGYDSLLFVAAPGVTMTFDHAGRKSTIRLTPAQAATDGQAPSAEDLRLEILRARLKARQGETETARDKLADLRTANPESTDVLVELASIEQSVGSWRRASGLYNRAISLDPERRDAASAQRALDREFGEFVRVDTDYQKVHGGDDQIITVASGRFLPTEDLDMGFSFENRNLDDDQVQRVNGNIEAVSANKQRGEIYLGGSPASGHRIEGALLASRADPGAALRYTWRTPDTLTRIAGTYHRAYWELVEGIADDATQDRVSLRHEHQFDLNWSGDAEIGINRYGIGDIDEAATSMDMAASVRYLLPLETTDMSVGYSFNGSYVGSQEIRIDANGNAFKPLPITNTEIHSIDTNLAGVFGEDWRYNLFASLSYNRFGGFGPSFGAELTHEVWEDFQYGLRAGHSRVSGRGDDAAFSRLGGFFLVRF